VKPATKKIISLFFILVGLAPLLYIPIITVKKHEVRHRMKEKMERQTLQTIVLPEGEVVWMDKHEIWVNEHMFDIHSKELKNGIYTFIGLYDEEETTLVLKEKNATRKNKEENKILAQLFQCIHTIFYKPHAAICHVAFQHDNNSTLISGEAVAQFKEILTPPPRVSC
jgi:hypothetical protein